MIVELFRKNHNITYNFDKVEAQYAFSALSTMETGKNIYLRRLNTSPWKRRTMAIFSHGMALMMKEYLRRGRGGAEISDSTQEVKGVHLPCKRCGGVSWQYQTDRHGSLCKSEHRCQRVCGNKMQGNLSV